MDRNGRLALKIQVKVQEQSDGSWLASGVKPPFIVATRNAGEIDGLVGEAVTDLLRVLYRHREPGQEIEDVLRELAVPYEWEPASSDSSGAEERAMTVRVPDLVPA